VRRVQEGEGTATGSSRGRTLPGGLQIIPEANEEAQEDANLVEVEWGMATVMDSVEFLNPTYEEARKCSDWPKWQDAIKAELASLEANKMWTVVEHPKDVNVVGCKWVLRMKKNAAGEVEKYKARLVARGFTQIYGVDFYKTYAPVARLSSLWLLLVMANRNGWPVDSFDFDSAYLNSVLSDDEVIYLEQPAEYAKGNPKERVFRLRKALYGLKQGARSWYETLRKALGELGFQRVEADHSVFMKRWEDGRFVVMGVHVDNCMAIGMTQNLLDEFKVRMNKKYHLTNLGPCRWLLGIKIERDLEGKTTALSRHAYIESIISRFNFDDLKPSSIPMDPSAPLLKSQCPMTLAGIARMKNVPYREAVGSLMYAAMGTRPDIAFATSTVVQYMDNPGWEHWEAVKRIFWYLKGTKDMKLVYGDRKTNLEGFVDADGASQDHRRYIRLRFYGGWRGRVMVIEEAGVGHVINNRGRVCGGDAHCKGSSMVAPINWRNFFTTQGTHHSAWQQQVSDRACPWRSVPCEDETYRYPIPLYPVHYRS